MRKRQNPRILVITPEITYLPAGMGNMANRMRAKAGGLADVSASLVSSLFELGADVHVALPHYRRMFHVEVSNLIADELRTFKRKLPNSRIHLAEDRAFYYMNSVYGNYGADEPRLSLAFQREVINNIIPTVKPHLIHCNDWMTGLIPAMARRENIPCLFTIHNIHTWRISLDAIEDRGIDAAEFWRFLYFMRVPINYEESRTHNQVDMLTSGIFASHYINTVSPTFLREIVDGKHDFIPPAVRQEIAEKVGASCAVGILNAPDPSYCPMTDDRIETNYGPDDHVVGKRENKLALQKKLGLLEDPNAPVFFWPSRLDPSQKGCQLLTHILYDIISAYWESKLQVVVVANGTYQEPFRNIVKFHEIFSRAAICDFDETLSRLGYAGSDFMFMPSLFEPCGLPQMIGTIYGTLPLVHDTGGLHDTIEHLDAAKDTGNGFVFETFDSGGLRWAVTQAMLFHVMPETKKEHIIKRIMTEGKKRFTHAVTAKAYFDIYEEMLQRPLVPHF